MDFLNNVGNEFVRQGKAGADYAVDAYDAYMKYIGEPFDKGVRKVGSATGKGFDSFTSGLSDPNRKPIGPNNKYGNKELSRDIARLGSAAGKGTDTFIADLSKDQSDNIAGPKTPRKP